MRCFEGLIGMKGFCSPLTYKYFLDDLGISLKTASKLADERFVFKGQELVERKINDAIEQTIGDLQFDSKITRPIIEDVSTSCLTPTLYTSDGEVVLHSFSSLKCKYSKFYIGSITIPIVAQGDLVIDLIQGNTTENLYDGAPTEDVVLYLNREVGNFTIRVAYSAGLQTYTCSYPSLCYITASQTQTKGLYIDFQLRCSIEKHVCKFADLIAGVARYKAAAMILNEINLTNNLNEYIVCKDKSDLFIQMAMLDSTFNLKRYEEEFRAEKGMYQRELEKLKLPALTCSCCTLECKDKNYVHELNLP